MSRLSLLLRLSLRSLAARRVTVGLAALSIALSAALLLSVETIRGAARASFAGTISDTDLIMGARTGGVQLMLYSVFRLGSATNNLTWESFQDIAADPAVDWIAPISLGDSHRGFRVLGTNNVYVERYRYRGGQALTFRDGRWFEDLFDVVIGADVAEELGYALGDQIVVSHGVGEIDLVQHAATPFTIVGVFEKSGTPVDRTLHVSLEAYEAIHLGWRDGRPPREGEVSAEDARQADLTPRAVTAALIGATSRLEIFDLQRRINEYREEPLTAVLPGVALAELWGVVGVAETALTAVALAVVAAAALGMATMLLASLGERRREMAILRSVGAGPAAIASMLMVEAAVIAVIGLALGAAVHIGVLWAARDWLDATYGLYLTDVGWSASTWTLFAAAGGLALLSGLAPAWRAYRLSLAEGVGVRF